MTASDYPITEEYGWQISYPLHTSPADPAVPSNEKENYPGTGYGFHTGRDWGCPMGTPIIVNGVQIGLSGNTGETFGPHVHVGRYVGGVATNPETPWVFNSAVVTEIGEDATNGKYVRVQADGASYVYLHMSQQTATKGQVLKGGNMGISQDELALLTSSILNRQPTAGDSGYVGRSWQEVATEFYNSGEHKAIIAQYDRANELEKQAKNPDVTVNGQPYKPA